jgi:transposase
MRITQLDYEYFRDSIEELMSRYREEFSIPVTTNWRDYEFFYRQRMKGMALEFRAMIDESSSFVVEEFGRPSLLEAREKVFIILVKEIFRLSNRKAAYLLPLLGISKDISYKTIERLYSDPLVLIILNNLFMNSLKRKGVASVDASGDGTGYSLTVTKHYRSLRERNGETVKEGKFVYSFALMDLETRMYVGYAVSVKSEKDAYHKALEMIGKMRIDLKSIRLDKYYSGQSILEDFNENTMIFLIPESNSRIRGRRNWREIIRRFMDDPMNYLREYFKRNASESGFSSDKRAMGGLIYQRRKDRKETSGFCKGLIHNLMLLHG